MDLQNNYRPKGVIKAQERTKIELFELKNGYKPLLNKTNH